MDRIKSVVLYSSNHGVIYDYDLIRVEVASLILDNNGVQSVVIENIDGKDVYTYPTMEVGDEITLNHDPRGIDIDKKDYRTKLDKRIKNLFNILITDLTIKSNVVEDNRDFVRYLKDNNIEQNSYTEKDLANYINSSSQSIEIALDSIFNNKHLADEISKSKLLSNYKDSYNQWKGKKRDVLKQVEKEGESAISEVKGLVEEMKTLSQEPSLLHKLSNVFTSKMEK